MSDNPPRGQQERINQALAILSPHRARNEAIEDTRHDAITRAWIMLQDGRTPEENSEMLDNPKQV